MIKHFVRDLLINIFHYSGASFAYRICLKQRGPLVRVLCFHDVAGQEWFSSLLDLIERKYHTITPEQFENEEFDRKKINILLTFDDGYQSWVEVAMPELAKRNIKALFFTNSGLLEAKRENNAKASNFIKEKVLLNSERNVLSWDGARKLKASGHTIGSHTVDHSRMSGLSSDQARTQMQEDKNCLTNELDEDVHTFAYPFGTKHDYTTETISLGKEVGFTQQFSAVSGFAKPGQKIIPRTLVEDDISANSLKKMG